MIVMKQPSALRLFFIMQGSVVPRIIDKIIGVALLSALVLIIDKFCTLCHMCLFQRWVFWDCIVTLLGVSKQCSL